MVRKLHFKNKTEYDKWLRWNFENDKNKMLDGKNSEIYIAGKKHRVNHIKEKKKRITKKRRCKK